MTTEDHEALDALPPDTRALVATAMGPYAHHVEARLARTVLGLAKQKLTLRAALLHYAEDCEGCSVEEPCPALKALTATAQKETT